MSEDGDSPPYVKNLKAAQDRVCEALLRGQTTREKKKIQSWKVTTPSLPRQRSLDIKYGTIYSMKNGQLVDNIHSDEHTLERELTDCSSLNLDSAREKLYIREYGEHLGHQSGVSSHREDSQQQAHYVIKEYREPVNIPNTNYANPRLASRDQARRSVSEVVDLFVKEHSGYKVKAQRQKIKRCRQRNVKACQFCEVLGPVSCAMCIERTDRHFAQKVEEKTLPTVEKSVSNIVATGLSKTMKRGVQLMQRHIREDHLSKTTTVNLPPI